MVILLILPVRYETLYYVTNNCYEKAHQQSVVEYHLSKGLMKYFQQFIIICNIIYRILLSWVPSRKNFYYFCQYFLFSQKWRAAQGNCLTLIKKSFSCAKKNFSRNFMQVIVHMTNLLKKKFDFEIEISQSRSLEKFI